MVSVETAVAVPLITPDELRTSPGGKLPDTNVVLKVIGSFDAEVAVRAIFTPVRDGVNASFNDAIDPDDIHVTVSGFLMVMLREELVAEGASKLLALTVKE